jgi:hypothetical protein
MSALNDSLRLDSLFDRIREQESALASFPSNDRLARDLLVTAHDTTVDCFYVIGKGTTDTAFPESAQSLSQKISAKYSAEKWALYCKAMLSGRKIPYGSPISGEVLYSKDIRKRLKNDTLFVMFKVPVGSIR